MDGHMLKKNTKVILILSTYILLPGAVFGCALVLPFILLFWHACDVVYAQNLTDISGYDFEITETSCDAIAKWGEVSIAAAPTGHQPKTEIFNYDPIAGRPFPTIRVSADRRILISVPDIYEIRVRLFQLGDVPITYDIGDIVYPKASQPNHP